MIRTRIAPSPTGSPHVGTAYIALFNYCFAQKNFGEFILRIEDTDQARSRPDHEKAIMDSLKWLGLTWKEGPDVGGKYGPYRQSERTEIYKRHVEFLLEDGHAFYCFCSAERLSQLRKDQARDKKPLGYDGHCLHMSHDEVDAALEAGTEHVIRMKVPREGTCTFTDGLRGETSIPWEQVDMQILLKSDGFPTYHLANVVDDHLMEITHVIRGEEWMSSTPKHVLLYQYFGWTAPEFYHLPLLRNPDKSKLSKRKNPTSIEYYRRSGYLPEALLNYLGRMGWSMPNDAEKFSLYEMTDAFDLKRVSLGGPTFDVTKLKWLNAEWIRGMGGIQFAVRMMQWAINDSYLTPMVPLIQPRIETLADALPLAVPFFTPPVLTADSFAHKKLTPDACKEILQTAIWKFGSQADFLPSSLMAAAAELGGKLGHKLRDFVFPLFIAIGGKSTGTPIFETMSHIGRDITIARLRTAVEVLGGYTTKDLGDLETKHHD